MANINDFKLLNLKCGRYFDLLEKELNRTINIPVDKKHRERFGFYLFMLESICKIKDISDIISIITDQEFNSMVLNQKDEDFGVDAIHIIDEGEEKSINLFNFKYREKFNEDRQQSINETFLTTKFTNAIIAEKTNSLSGKLKKLTEDIINRLNGNDVWKLKLYVISNENKELDIDSPEISQLKDLYGLETHAIGLDTITNLMSIRPSAINATLHIDKDSILPFVESSLSSSKSYIIKISANDLIRITCDNAEHRENYKMENFAPLSTCSMDYNVLFDNVRGLVIKSKYNENIFKTLKEEPTRFFMYNNGLTITANDIISEDTNANKKVKISIKDFQVVNGGQTLRTIHDFSKLDQDHITKYLSSCELLLRVFKTPTTNNIRNKIAEYTNSQNSISSIDLKSLNSQQIQIEQFLDAHNIIYARKAGDTGLSEKKNYIHKISMEKFGQILFSIIGGTPEKASNQKKQIFDKYYQQIFNENVFDINKSAYYVKRYYELKQMYDQNKKNYESTDQKIFYLLYLDSKLETMKIEQKMDLLEKIIKEYIPVPGKPIQESRKLILSKFKEFLDDKIKSYL